MAWLASWSSGPIVAVLAVAVGTLLGGLLLLAWRAPVLLKLGVRNVARRPLRAALIVFGLMLSTMVVGSAFAVGDSMTFTLRTLVAENFGSVDEVVVIQPPRSRFGARIRAATQPGLGALGAAGLGFFGQSEVAQVMDAAEGSDAIAGLAPAILDEVTVVHEGNQRLQSALPLLAVQLPMPAGFGPLLASDGALDALGPHDALMNVAAADLLGAAAGETLTLLPDGTTWKVRIAATLENQGIAGSQPLLVVPLARYQRVLQRSGAVNVVLVANAGGVESVTRSAEAAGALRANLADRAVAQRLHDLLGGADLQQGLRQVEGSLQGRERAALAALRSEAALPQMTDHFISLIAEPRMRQRLLSLAWALPGWSQSQATVQSLRDLTALSVLEVKQSALEQAEDLGAAITTLFLVLGIFSVAAAVMLIFLIFGILAVDRRAELATMRALGMRRRQLAAMFLLEGSVYALVGAALGTLASLVSGYLIVSSLSSAVETFGLNLDPYVSPRSLFIGFALGLLLTVGAMILAVWRASRLEIVAATRGDAVEESAVPRLVFGAVLLSLAILIWLKWRTPAVAYLPRHPLIAPASLSFALVGMACCLAPMVRSKLRTRPPGWSSGPAACAGVAVATIWWRSLASLPTPGGRTTIDATTLSIGGLVLILAVVWTGTQALGPLLKLLDYGLSFTGRIRAVVRPAAAHLSHERWRTGLTVVMFATVIFIMTVSLVLIDAVLKAYAGEEPPVAGFDLRAELGGASTEPGFEMEAALADAPAVSRAAFTAIGSIATREVQLVELGLPVARWEPATLMVADDGFLNRVQARTEQSAAGYGSGAAIWRALRERPGTAVVTARMQRMTFGSPFREDMAFEPLAAWVRPGGGRPPIELAVIGIVDARSELEHGIYISQATAAALGDLAAPPSTFFFAVDPATGMQNAIEGLRLSFADRGIRVVEIADELQLVTALRLLLTGFVQSFMALGLIAGIAALGLLGIQSIIERRRQLGALRALGFTRRQMRSTLALESVIVAAAGITVGIMLGLFLSRTLVSVLAASFPELQYAVPWQELAFTTTLAWLGSFLAIATASWEAGRVSPIDAMRAS